MRENRLREAARALHEALARGERVDPALREELGELAREIQASLEEPPEGLRERVERTLARLEAEHPILTEALERTLRALSEMGI